MKALRFSFRLSILLNRTGEQAGQDSD